MSAAIWASPWCLNPWDEFAVEEALQLVERFDGEAAVITMGSADAAEALKRAVAMGVEEAILLSDPAFDGSDAWGTAHILAQAIKKAGRLHASCSPASSRWTGTAAWSAPASRPSWACPSSPAWPRSWT